MTRTTSPTVSVVIPVFNGEKHVGAAIRSVLEQSRPAVECIVIDDGSTDATAEAVRAFAGEVTYVLQENAGVSVARNSGAAIASGGLIGFLDHDDVWLPDKLDRQVQSLVETQATLALCAVTIIDDAGNPTGERRLRPRTDLLTGMLMFDRTETVSVSSTGLIWARDFRRLDGFDPQLGMSADWDLLFNVLLRGTLTYVDEPLVRYRVHDTNMSRNIAAMEHDMIYAYRKAFADPGLPEYLRVREREAYAQLYRMLSGSYRASGDARGAARMAAASLRKDPRALLSVARLRTVGRRATVR